MAVKNADLASVKYLVENGANVNMANDKNQKPLWKTTRHDSHNILTVVHRYCYGEKRSTQLFKDSRKQQPTMPAGFVV